MGDLDDSFSQLLGRQPSDKEKHDLYRVRDALKLKATDSVWLLLMALRIMRHQDPRLTTEVYGHLSPGYLKKEIERLNFGPAPADQGDSGASEAGSDGQSQVAAGGALESPQLAVTRSEARLAAPFTTRLLRFFSLDGG